MWEAIKSKDTKRFGHLISETHVSQKNMIPGYEAVDIQEEILNLQKKHSGAKLMGAGGYGYMGIVSENPEDDFMAISLRTRA